MSSVLTRFGIRSLVRMPSRAGRGAGNIAPSLGAERGGASGAALQTTEPSEGGRVRIDWRSQAAALEDGDPFGRRMTP